MDENCKNFDKKSKSLIKELTKDNESFNNLMEKLNFAIKNLSQTSEMTSALQQIKK